MKLSTVTIARDEADFIGGCLEHLVFADESIVVVDERSTDRTAQIAQHFGATIYQHSFSTFSEAKNFGISKAQNDWILIVDADERISQALGAEIMDAIASEQYQGYEIGFDSYFFAHQMHYGDWLETHIRLFRRDTASYQGDIHEQLVFRDNEHPQIGHLQEHIAHLSHRNITHNLSKTITYIDIQAREMYKAGHPRVSWKTFVRVIASKFWHHTIRHRGYKDGTVGWIECLYQPFSWFCIYVRLWELQQRPSLDEQYQQLEKEL